MIDRDLVLFPRIDFQRSPTLSVWHGGGHLRVQMGWYELLTICDWADRHVARNGPVRVTQECLTRKYVTRFVDLVICVADVYERDAWSREMQQWLNRVCV